MRFYFFFVLIALTLKLWIVNFQWVIFRLPSLENGLKFIKAMFINNNNDGTANIRTLLLIKEYYVFILAAIILCFPIVKWIESKLESKKRVLAAFKFLVTLAVFALFICALSFVVANKNFPFAYANF